MRATDGAANSSVHCPLGRRGTAVAVDVLPRDRYERIDQRAVMVEAPCHREHRRIGIGEPDRQAIDHVLSRFAPDERQRLDELLDAAADAVEAWAHDGTNKAANRFNPFELRPADAERLAAPGEVDGPPGPDGIRRTKTGWRRTRPPEAAE